MLRYSKYWTRIFFAPDADTSGASASGGQQQQQQGSQQTDVDPFAGLDLDDLDPETRKMVESSRERLTSLQKEKAEMEKKVGELDKNSKAYQSRHDQLQAQLDKLTGTNQVSAEARQKADAISQYEAVLKQKGVPDANAKAQAELMYDLLGVERERIKQEIGKDLAPFASLQLNREAEWAFQTSAANDPTGAMQDPDLAQEVWALVQQGAQGGQQMTPEIVDNLIAMTYVKAMRAGKILPQGTELQQQQTNGLPPMPQIPQLSRGTYPGAGNAPQRRVAPDPRAPKFALNSDTAAALKIVTNEWGKAGTKAPINKQ